MKPEDRSSEATTPPQVARGISELNDFDAHSNSCATREGLVIVGQGIGCALASLQRSDHPPAFYERKTLTFL